MANGQISAAVSAIKEKGVLTEKIFSVGACNASSKPLDDVNRASAERLGLAARSASD